MDFALRSATVPTPTCWVTVQSSRPPVEQWPQRQTAPPWSALCRLHTNSSKIHSTRSESQTGSTTDQRLSRPSQLSCGLRPVMKSLMAWIWVRWRCSCFSSVLQYVLWSNKSSANSPSLMNTGSNNPHNAWVATSNRPGLTIHLPGRHLAVPDHAGLKNTSQSRFSSARLQPLRQHSQNKQRTVRTRTQRNATVFRLFGGRPTSVDAHIPPEEVLPVTPGESHAHTGGKTKSRTVGLFDFAFFSFFITFISFFFVVWSDCV